MKLSGEERLYLQKLLIDDYNNITETINTGYGSWEDEDDRRICESVAEKLLITLDKEGLRMSLTKEDVRASFKDMDQNMIHKAIFGKVKE